MSNPYYMGPVYDQRDECRLNPNREVTRSDLAAIDVELSNIEMGTDWESRLDNLFAAYDMHHRDEIHISRGTMPDFDEKLKKFFEEHLHRDPEIRFIKSGSGYFDVRSMEDKWIRIPVKRGDFLYLPSGIYHRFTTDWNDNIVAIRLFGSSPKWEAFPRCKDGDSIEERTNYLKNLRITEHMESS